MILKTHAICIGLAALVGCGVEPSDATDPGEAAVVQASTPPATWGNPVVLEGNYGSDCRPTGVVDAGISNGEHFFEFYGDFRCGHSSSFPTPIYSWQCGINGTTTTARTTFTGTFQVNAAFTVPFEPFARCFVMISSWNHDAGDYEIIN